MSDFDVSMRLRMKNDLSKESRNAERDLNDLNNAAKKLGSVKTDGLAKNIGYIGQKADGVARNVDALHARLDRFGKLKIDNRIARQLDDVAKPAGRLDGVMGGLGRSAGAAFGAIAAFASIDSVIRGLEQLSQQYRKLNRDVASVAVTAEMRTPEAMARISKSNETLSIRYGSDQTSVNAARKTYAAAGVDIDSQEAILDPTIKTAKAEDSTGETIAEAVIAAKQNLGVKDSEIKAALDMMAKGAKLGSFEVDAMAKNFPSLATMLAGTGRQGLGGWSELIALAQVVRTGAGSQDDAATNLRNLLSKVSSKDTVQNFEKKGVSLEEVRKKADKEGKPYLTAVMNEVMRLTDGNEFRINELFGDQQAYLALKPLLDKRAMYEDFLKQIQDGSAGTVDADYDFLRNLPQEKQDRRSAAMSATGDKIGGVWDMVTDPGRDAVTGLVNPDYKKQEAEAQRNAMKALGADELAKRIADIQKRLGALPPEIFDPVAPGLGAARATGRKSIDEIQSVIDELKGTQKKEDGPPAWKRFLFGKGAEEGFNLKDHLGINLAPAADNAMQGYNDALAAQGEKAASEAQSIADRLRSILGFTVSPTISPTLTPPAATPTPAGENHSSLQQSSNVRLTQNISSPNPKLAAIRSRREQGRAIQQAQSRSLYDLGVKPA